MSESDFSHLLSPLRVGPKTLRNRLPVTAQVPRIADGDVPGDRYVAYHRAKARGGVAMQITGVAPVHRTSALGSRRALVLVAWRGSRATDGLREAIEAAGMELHAVGDSVAPRLAGIAVAEGALAARRI